MGMGHVPQDPLRAEGTRADVQGRQRRRAPLDRDLTGKTTPALARQARGRWGEDLAARWYEHAGFELLERNWRISNGELDLIVRRDRLIVFAEVKTRATDAYGDPASAVTLAKQVRIRRLAAAWLAATGVHGVDLRFDVVAVLGVRVRVIEAAF